MAGTSGCSRRLKELRLGEADPCAKGESDEAEYLTGAASEGDRATMSSSVLVARGESLMEREKSGGCSSSTKSVEEQIEHSKAHWSVLAESASIAEEDKSE